LFQTLKGTLLWNAVIERYINGALLGGSSAGAMIMGTSILACMCNAEYKDEKASWEKAFGLVDYSIYPHFDRFKKHKGLMRTFDQKYQRTLQSAWMGLDENTAILFRNDKELVLGKGKVEFHSVTN